MDNFVVNAVMCFKSNVTGCNHECTKGCNGKINAQTIQGANMEIQFRQEKATHMYVRMTMVGATLRDI